MSVADLITSRLLLKQCEEAESDELYRLWNEAGIRRSFWEGRLISVQQAGQVLQESLLLKKKVGVGCG